MAVPRFSAFRLTFLLVIPLAWAVLLLFRPAPDPDDIYGSLRDEPSRWLTVHFGTLLFIGLMGAALYVLVHGLSGVGRRGWGSGMGGGRYCRGDRGAAGRAPLAASILLALSAIALLHGPPTGPIGLGCFAAAVVVLAVTSARSAPVG